MLTTLWHLKYLLCVSQERSSSRRPNCVGMVLTPPAWQTDCSSWTPAEGAIPRWTKSFTSPSCQGNTNFDEQSEQHKGRIHTHTHMFPLPPPKKQKQTHQSSTQQIHPSVFIATASPTSAKTNTVRYRPRKQPRPLSRQHHTPSTHTHTQRT